LICSLCLDQNYRKRYWNEAYFEALTSIAAVAKAHNLTMAEIALRWISHHGLMSREHGDAVLIGASSAKHIKQVNNTGHEPLSVGTQIFSRI
jgi:aflatoxin B1 aldehyde reductase